MRPPLNTRQDAATIARRLRAAFGMYDVGLDMLRCRLRRENPDAEPEQIRQQIADFLRADRHDGPAFEKRTCSRFSAKS